MKKTIVLLFVAFAGSAFAQRVPDMGLFKVRISESDKNIVAEIKRPQSEPLPEPDRFYYWYSANHIKQTQGGYSGTLLNGQYQEFYLNKNLKQQGTFDNGLKTGEWKDWTEDGVLVQSVNWVNGVKHGGYCIYDGKGILKQKGRYRNNVLNGKQYTYHGPDTLEVATYKDGKVLPKPVPSQFWKKVNIFKKKNKGVAKTK